MVVLGTLGSCRFLWTLGEEEQKVAPDEESSNRPVARTAEEIGELNSAEALIAAQQASFGPPKKK